ncbi:MAG: potassium channel protein [Actinobacteria bacterium]|nr:potassium channel protein [Actinomycetota bacterium]
MLRRIWISIALLGVIILAGWAGYIAIEGFSPLDSIYMTVITISTVGFKEVQPLDAAGKILTIFIILTGTGTLLYFLLAVAEFAIEGHLTGILEKRRVEREVASLENHYIICGYGRVGEQIAKEFREAKVPFVVIEQNPERVSVLQALGILHVEGDASDDHVLMAAGVRIAKGLVAAVDTDAENVFVTLSARVLNPNLRIVSRAVMAEAEEKLTRAGADRVVSTILIGARRMAQLMVHPEISDYLELISHTAAGEYRLEEFTVGRDSPLAGKELQESDVRGKTGALVMAVRTEDGRLNANPPPDTLLHEGDRLIVLGTGDQLKALRDML